MNGRHEFFKGSRGHCLKSSTLRWNRNSRDSNQRSDGAVRGSNHRGTCLVKFRIIDCQQHVNNRKPLSSSWSGDDALVISWNLGLNYVAPCMIIYCIRILFIFHRSKWFHGLFNFLGLSEYTRVPVSEEVLRDLASLPSLTIIIYQKLPRVKLFLYLYLQFGW